MVFLTLNLLRKHITTGSESKFIDTLRLFVKGGHGGNGLPKYGGQGGQGGCVYVIAKEEALLKNIQRKYRTKQIKAGTGEDAHNLRLIGRRGADVEIPVPTGVKVVCETGKVLGELNKPGERCVAAGGGIGGCSGNNFIGTAGYMRHILLDLKLIADVGLVGFPNAGKSTFLKAISRAHPKIAAYPFTTIRPQIGVVEYPNLRQISVADLPGLIEGAHINVGMGYKFLKHVERTRLLLMVVDLFGFKLSGNHDHRTCLENVYALNKELELYDKELLKKPCILLLNKIDVDGSQMEYDKIKEKISNLPDHINECRNELIPEEFIKFDHILPISAKEGQGIEEAKQAMKDVLDYYAEQELLAETEQNGRTR